MSDGSGGGAGEKFNSSISISSVSVTDGVADVVISSPPCKVEIVCG